MKNLKYAVSGLLSVLLVPASLQCFAQAATLSDCQGIQDRLARYACYDKWDAASGTVRQSAPAPRTTTTRAPAGDEAASFGRPPAREAAEEQAPQIASEGAAPATEGLGGPQGDSNARLVDGDLFDTIAALEPRGTGRWLVTLSSGQQWLQNYSKPYPLEVGDQVRIYSTRWGDSYRMSVERMGGFIQVARVDTGASLAVSPTTPAPGFGIEPAPRGAQEDDEPSLLGRMGSRIGGIFSRDDEEGATESASGATPEPVTTEGFGRTASAARVVEGDEGAELIDTVASLQEVGPNLWLVTLDSGQRWRQMISKRYQLEVGDEVRIYPTRWGNSFRLSVEKVGGYIQVERAD